MEETAVRIRRGRREDFDAIRALFEALGLPAPAADRRTLRRFRHIVADLGADFYVAVVDGRVVGVVHCVYSRDLLHGQQGRIERLVVSAAHRDRGIEDALLALIVARARKRACARLCWVPSQAHSTPAPVLASAGLTGGGQEYLLRLDCRD